MKNANQYTNPWKKDELEILKDINLTHNEVAEKIERSYQAVKIKRLELNIDAKSEIDYWSAEHIIFLQKNRGLNDKEIAEKIGRTPASVQQKRLRLGLLQISKNYDEYEIEYLIVNYNEKSKEEIATFLGRSISSIQSKAYELGITKKSDYWTQIEIDILKDNIKCSNDELAGMLNKSRNQIAYKKAHLSSIEKRSVTIDEKIDSDIPFSARGKINRYIDVLSVMKINDSLEFPSSEYQLVMQAKKYVSHFIFSSKKESETTRRIWRLN